MKKLFTVLAVVIAVQFGTAQNDAFKQDAIKVIEKSGAGAQFGMVLDQIKTMVPEDRHEELTKDFNSTLPSLYFGCMLMHFYRHISLQLQKSRDAQSRGQFVSVFKLRLPPVRQSSAKTPNPDAPFR